MQQEHEGKVTVKLFAGCHVDSEIRMLLGQSKAWKQASITPAIFGTMELTEVHFHGKDYLGHYLKTQKVTLGELKVVESQIRSLLKSYFADLETEEVKIRIFPQVFVA